MTRRPLFFFNDTATTEIYTLSLHDALPIYPGFPQGRDVRLADMEHEVERQQRDDRDDRQPPHGGGHVHRWASPDRNSTRLNSSHANISYAVFCLKKKKKHMFLKTNSLLQYT